MYLAKHNYNEIKCQKKGSPTEKYPIQMRNGRELNNNEQRETLLMKKKTNRIKKIITCTVDTL